MINSDIEEKKQLVISYLNSQYHIDITQFPSHNVFIENSLKSILSLKIWKKYLESQTFKGSMNYFTEIISNLNQILILSSTGFKIPSVILIRRSYDNLSNFVFFKDHPIEYTKREIESNKKYLKFEDFNDYVSTFPFEVFHPTSFDKIRCKELIKLIMETWSQEYSELSRYVHATSRDYLELTEYIHQITPQDSTLSFVNSKIVRFNSILNTVNVIFFFEAYREIEISEKTILRKSIENECRYKDLLIGTFSEI